LRLYSAVINHEARCPMQSSGLEEDRLAALDRYDVLDTGPEKAFDRITRMARTIFDVPISTITFVDGHRQWFKSQNGLSNSETPREVSFCNLAVRQAVPLVVPDTWADNRFRDNAFVQGPPFIRFYAGAQLRTPQGYNIGTLCIIDQKPHTLTDVQITLLADLADAVMSQLELRMLAIRDGLTGVLSRRAFRDEANRAIAQAIRQGYSLSCAIFDLDHFKAVNDTHGHAVGDAVLMQSVQACVASVRKSDVLGRIGGEEFAIVFPDANSLAAMKIAEKARKAIAGVSVLTERSESVSVSASFGVATMDKSIADVDELLRRADTALYASKSSGRNRCSQWVPPDAQDHAIMRRVLKAGQIAFNRGSSNVECTVRALSDTGAAIDVIAAAALPDRFKLRVDSDGWSRLCKVLTRQNTRLEVAFE
jgi:diguanylate cyclase (GGDEF)-like protein